MKTFAKSPELWFMVASFAYAFFYFSFDDIVGPLLFIAIFLSGIISIFYAFSKIKRIKSSWKGIAAIFMGFFLLFFATGTRFCVYSDILLNYFHYRSIVKNSQQQAYERCQNDNHALGHSCFYNDEYNYFSFRYRMGYPFRGKHDFIIYLEKSRDESEKKIILFIKNEECDSDPIFLEFFHCKYTAYGG